MIRKLNILILIFTCLIYSCEPDNPTVTDEDKLTESFSTTYFDYYYSKSDRDIIDTAWQEHYCEWLISQLDINLPEKLQYLKYRDNTHIETVTGQSGNGFAEIGTYKFHTIGFMDNHECVHTIVTQLIGHPTALFNEGIAVAFQANYFGFPDFIPSWNGDDLHILAKNFKQNNNLPMLDELLGVISYWDYSEAITYPTSGSFVRYMIDNYGIEKVKAFISTSDFYDTKEKIHSDFYSTYGLTIEDAWADWNQFIVNYE